MIYTRVVIIGGGFGGLNAAKALSKANIDVLLIDKKNHHLFQPLLYQVASAALSPADIATPLRDSGVISPTIAHMVAVGEKSGELENMLKNISENLEASTDIVIERLSALVEPIIIIVMAAIVGVIAYATILPILEISSGEF